MSKSNSALPPLVMIAAGLAFGIVLGLGILFGSGMWGQKPQEVDSLQTSNQVQIGLPAPDFELETLDGESLRLSDLRGRVVALNFWATWCGPCVQEMPLFERFAQEFADQMVFVGANMEESRTQVQPFIEKIGIQYPILLDPQGEAIRLYKVIALPNTFFIDAQGVVQYRHIGLVSESQLAEYLAKLGVGE